MSAVSRTAGIGALRPIKPMKASQQKIVDNLIVQLMRLNEPVMATGLIDVAGIKQEFADAQKVKAEQKAAKAAFEQVRAEMVASDLVRIQPDIEALGLLVAIDKGVLNIGTPDRRCRYVRISYVIKEQRDPVSGITVPVRVARRLNDTSWFEFGTLEDLMAHETTRQSLRSMYDHTQLYQNLTGE